MAKVYRDRDAKLTALRRKTVAIIGYGIQGRPHALCLRDSGVAPPGGRTRRPTGWPRCRLRRRRRRVT
jgi:ketol-acid reductoisomerase